MPPLRTAHEGQTATKTDPITEVNSVVMDLMAFKTMAKISAVLHNVSEAESTLCKIECPPPPPRN